MKKIIAVLFAVAMSLCVTSIVMAETDEQAVKEKNVAKTVKKRSSNDSLPKKRTCARSCAKHSAAWMWISIG